MRPSRATARPLDVPAGLGLAEAVRRLAHRDRVTAWAGAGIVTCDPERCAPATADPFVVLAEQPAVEPGGAHVGGGWFGYLPFSGAHSLAWYPDLLRFDGLHWWYESLGPDRHAELAADLRTPADLPPARLRLSAPPDLPAHVVAVEECILAIRRGDIYQANIATALDLHLDGPVHDAFACLLEAHRPAMGCLVADPELAAVSLTPELFLRRVGREVRTAPIKGTRPRTGRDDAAERARLAASTKDAAENVMIVDLMRNDLARVCATGTVTVPRLLAVEPHAGVWHLVSDVRAVLAEGHDDADLLRAAFPPGSVTGAPKIRAVELIEELEPVARRLFTGALGWASPIAGLELAVTIRTLEVAPGGRARLGVGGGVTVESTPIEEWAECLTKAAPILETLGAAVPPAPPASAPGGLFETMLAVDGRVRRLADHVGRLRRSFGEVHGRPLVADVAAVARAAVRGLAGPHRLRLDAAPDGRVAATVTPFAPVPLAAQPGLVLRIRAIAVGERHKLADRSAFDAHEAAVAPGETPLLVDDAGVVLESTRSSVFAVRAGEVRTPPLDGRILPGVTRLAVLDRTGHPAVVSVAQLAAADGVFLTNALRGVQWVRELRDPAGATLATWAGPDPTTARIAAADTFCTD